MANERETLAQRALKVTKRPKKAELWELLSNVMWNGDWGTDSAARLASYCAPRRPKYEPDALAWVSTAAEDSRGPRMALRYVRSIGGQIVGTNGKILFLAPTPEGVPEGFFNVNDKHHNPADFMEDNGLEFPVFHHIIPAPGTAAEEHRLTYGDWADVRVVQGDVWVVQIGPAWFDLELLNKAWAGAVPSSVVTVTARHETTAARFDLGDGRLAVVMPFRVEP